MKEYKPVRGFDSEEKADAFLKENSTEINANEIDGTTLICPMLKDDCREEFCAAWQPAKTILMNPGRMKAEDGIYGIQPGFCKSPLITGKFNNV